MKDSNLFAYIGFVSAIFTIGDFTYKFIKNNQFYISKSTFFFIIIFIVSFTIYFLLKLDKGFYIIKKELCYFFRNGDSYITKEKECIYKFISRTEMSNTKNYKIISKIRDLNRYSDQFKWSKEQQLEDIKIRSNKEEHNISLKRDQNWFCYDIEFETVRKGAEVDLSVTIHNLKDPKKESLLFFSSGIREKTKRLILTVLFPDTSLKPINIKYQIFDNYVTNCPIIEEKLNFNIHERKIQIIENKPIFGYKYLIKWDFEES